MEWFVEQSCNVVVKSPFVGWKKGVGPKCEFAYNLLVKQLLIPFLTRFASAMFVIVSVFPLIAANADHHWHNGASPHFGRTFGARFFVCFCLERYPLFGEETFEDLLPTDNVLTDYSRAHSRSMVGRLQGHRLLPFEQTFGQRFPDARVRV